MSSENEGAHLPPKKRRPERRHDQQNNNQARTDPKPDQGRDYQLPPNDVNSESQTRESTERYKEQQEGGDNGSKQGTPYSTRPAAKKQGGEGRRESPIRSCKVSKNTENRGSYLFQKRLTHKDVEGKNLRIPKQDAQTHFPCPTTTTQGKYKVAPLHFLEPQTHHWQMKLIYTPADGYQITDKWDKFVKACSLKANDMIIFSKADHKHQSPSNGETLYVIRIERTDAAEADCGSQDADIEDDSSGSGESYESVDDSSGSDQSYKPETVTQSAKPVKGCRSAKPVRGCSSGGDGGWKGKAPMDSYEEKGVNRGRGNPGKLLFDMFLSHSDVNYGFLTIPKVDAEKYFPSLTTPEGNYEKKILQISDDQNTKWKMTLALASQTCGLKRIYGDWSKFVQECYLKANDKIIFYKIGPSNKNSYLIRIERTNEAVTGPEETKSPKPRKDNGDGVDDHSKKGKL